MRRTETPAHPQSGTVMTSMAMFIEETVPLDPRECPTESNEDYRHAGLFQAVAFYTQVNMLSGEASVYKSAI